MRSLYVASLQMAVDAPPNTQVNSNNISSLHGFKLFPPVFHPLNYLGKIFFFSHRSLIGFDYQFVYTFIQSSI